MDGNTLFQILIGFIFGLFALVFLILYLYDRRYASSGWLCMGYLMGLCGFAMDVIGMYSNLYITLFTNTFFWLTSAAIAAAACARVYAPFPLRIFAALMLLGYTTNIYFTSVMPDVSWRSSFTNLVAGVIIGMCLPALSANRRSWMDKAVFYCIASMAAISLLRPALAFGFFAFDDSLQSYMTSGYSLTLHMSLGISALAAAVIMMMAIGFDIAERLQRESDTDHLTRLYNQRGIANFVEEYDDELGSQGAMGRAVLMFDIDHFKQINDEFGHDTGDLVLTKIGRTIRQLMKYHGIAGRSGGEEFVFLFSKESSQAAFLVSEHLRVALGMLSHSGLPEDKRITVSLGLAFVRADEPVKRAIRRADTALYQAKDEGRNRLRLADGDTLPDPDENQLLPRVSSIKEDPIQF